MLRTRIFFFSHNIFKPFKDKNCHFSHFYFVIFKSFNLDQPILQFGKELIGHLQKLLLRRTSLRFCCLIKSFLSQSFDQGEHYCVVSFELHSGFNPLPHNTALKIYSFGKHCNKQFLLFSRCFLPYMVLIFHFKCTLKSRLQFCLSLDQSKICRLVMD